MAPQKPDVLKFALWYAKRGIAVFPLHNPIFNAAGNCTGCTCEEWKRTQPEYGPDFKCPQPGKCPRVKWADKSTTDVEQVRKWWNKPWRNVDVETGQFVWNLPNIGIDAGKSGLLLIDADTYKENYAGATFQFDENTIKTLTGGGGNHLWYAMPAGKSYGNAKGNLPAGNDVRGVGGYIVAPPSMHKSGKRYGFIAGHSPADIKPLPLPQFLIDILEAAQPSRAAASVHFDTGDVDAPDLAQWHLSGEILDLIHNGAPKGGRSEANYRVILALAKVGATDNDILAVFVHCAIGEKYREKGGSGNKYLGHSIGKARAWLANHPPAPPAAIELLNRARQWARSADYVAKLRAAGVRRVADLIPVLDALIEIAQLRRTMRVVVTVRDLADHCAMSKSSAQRRLSKLADICLVTTEPTQYGTLVDLKNVVDLSGTISPNVKSVPLRSTSGGDFFADHRIDDAFQSYPKTYAIKRRGLPEDTELNPGLNSSGLLLWEALADGGSVKDLSEVTGLTVAAVRATLKRYDQSGLLVIWEEGRSKWYELHPNIDERLDEARPQMTTYGIGQLRAARNASERASYAQRKLQGRMPLDAGERDKLEARRDKEDIKAEAYHESLAMMGINPHAKVRHREPRLRNKFDHGEEWVSIHRPIVEMWDELAPAPFAERYRMMGYAGYEVDDIDTARRMAGKMGRGPRVFVGFDAPAEAVAA